MLRFTEGFEEIATGQLSRRFDIITVYGDISDGRFGQGLVFTNNSSYVGKSFASQSSWLVGVAYKIQVVSGGGIIALRDSGTSQLTLCIGEGNNLVLRRGSTAGVEIASSTAIIQPDTWHFLELKVVIGSSGSFEVRLDGDVVMQGVGNTQATVNATANQIMLLGTAIQYVSYDDLYIADGGDTFYGDTKVTARVPVSTVLGNWTTYVEGVANYQTIDELPVSTADYNTAASQGLIDIFTFQSIESVGTIRGVQITLTANKSDAGRRSVRVFCKIGATSYYGPTWPLLLTVKCYSHIFAVNPATGSAWTQGTLTSAQFGYEVVE